MEISKEERDKNLLKYLTILVFVIVLIIVGFSAHSCICNPVGPSEFHAGYAPVL